MVKNPTIKFIVFLEKPKHGRYLKSKTWFQAKKEVYKRFKKYSPLYILKRRTFMGWDGIMGPFIEKKFEKKRVI